MDLFTAQFVVFMPLGIRCLYAPWNRNASVRWLALYEEMY